MHTDRLLTVGSVCVQRGVCPGCVCVSRYVCDQGVWPGGGCVTRVCTTLDPEAHPPPGSIVALPGLRARHRPPREQNDWPTGVKTLPSRNLRALIILNIKYNFVKYQFHTEKMLWG